MAFHSLLRWKRIILPILTTSLIHFSLKDWENVLFGLGGHTRYACPYERTFSRPCNQSIKLLHLSVHPICPSVHLSIHPAVYWSKTQKAHYMQRLWYIESAFSRLFYFMLFVSAHWHRGSTLFFRGVTLILSQRLLHKMTNSSAVFRARLHVHDTSRLSQDRSLASILTDKFVKCIFHNISCAQEERSLDARDENISQLSPT